MFVSCESSNRKCHLVAVLDGHGRYGHLVSGYLAELIVSPGVKPLWENMHTGQEKLGLTVLVKRLEVSLLNNKQINSQFSGTTIALVLIDYAQGLLFTANVGDSRVVRVIREKGTLDICELTIDHKPNELIERLRIMKMGGDIINDRVYLKGERMPGLNMSRSLGDTVAKQAGVISTPDINSYRIKKG